MKTPIDGEVDFSVDASQKKVIMELEDLSCADCAKKIQLLLGRVPGVEEAKVSFASSLARVTFDPQAVDVDRLRHTVQQTGYRVRNVRE